MCTGFTASSRKRYTRTNKPMDNFKKYKKRRGHSHTAPVEGFVSSASRPHRGAVRPSSGPVFNRTTDRPQLGNFRRADGLHPTQQGKLGFEAVKPAEAIVAGRQPVRDPSGQIKVSPKPLAKAKKKRHIGRIIKRGALVTVALVLLGGGFIGLRTYWQSRKILAGGGGAAALQENVDPTALNGEGDGRVNILLMGTGGANHDNGSYLVDTIIVASIDPIHKEAALLSIPRDFYVKTKDSGSMRINAVFKTARSKALKSKPKEAEAANRAGTSAMEAIVEETMGLPIHYNALIDFTGFENAINTVGGIDMNVPADLAVYEVLRINNKNYTLNVKAGQQHFDGFRALAFARSRKTSARGDFDRSERQRLMLVALKDKISSLGTLANPVKVNQLLSDFGDHARATLTVSELLRVYDIMKEVPGDKIQSVSLVDEPNVLIKSANIGGSVQIPRAGLNNYKEIQSFLRNKLQDGFLRDENASIAVYNGTNVTGLADRTAVDLKSYGYNITAVANAPTKTYTRTIIVDMRSGQKKYTQHYLEKRLDTTAVTTLPEGITAGTADFVIILGSNEVNRLN